MNTYTITLTEKERDAVLHCLARVESIIEMHYTHATNPKEKKRRKEDSEFLVALWRKIKATESATQQTT